MENNPIEGDAPSMTEGLGLIGANEHQKELRVKPGTFDFDIKRTSYYLGETTKGSMFALFVKVGGGVVYEGDQGEEDGEFPGLGEEFGEDGNGAGPTSTGPARQASTLDPIFKSIVDEYINGILKKS